MDFVVGLQRTMSGNDTTWVIVDRLTKSAYFITIKATFQWKDLLKIMYPRLLGCMECQNLSFQIVMGVLPLNFGRVFILLWGRN